MFPFLVERRGHRIPLRVWFKDYKQRPFCYSYSVRGGAMGGNIHQGYGGLPTWVSDRGVSSRGKGFVELHLKRISILSMGSPTASKTPIRC